MCCCCQWRRKTLALEETGALGGSRACVCVARPCARARRRCRHPRRVERPIIALKWWRAVLKLACSERERYKRRTYLAGYPAFVATYVEDACVREEVGG